MSERRSLQTPSLNSLVGIVGRIRDVHPQDPELDYKRVHGRFNLTLYSPDSEDVLENIDNPKERYLITPADSLTTQISQRLEEEGVVQLESYAELDGLAFFRVPLQAKPLTNERLFPGHESTDTYISDGELFRDLGHIWRQIYEASGYLPTENILARTGMIEFTKAGGRLFPIPPFSDWKQLESLERAEQIFEDQVLEELQEAYPQRPLGDLSHAALIGFKG